MKRKKNMIVSMVMIFSLIFSIQAFGRTDSVINRDLNPIPTDDFREIIEEITEIRAAHPDWDEIAILDFLDEKTSGNTRNGLTDIWNSLTNAEKKLIIRYPFDALKVNDAKSIATNQTNLKFKQNGLGNRSDAFRHGIWNAEMTIMIGAQKAELFATAHEEKDTSGMESDGFLKTEHKAMDLHNNNVGRNIGTTNVNAGEDDLANIIFNNISQPQSDFIWLHE